MSDIQRDREERQHYIEVLKQMRLDYEDFWEENDTEEIKAFNYAIASIETDLRYDLLYEETSGQADKPTTKNDLGVDCVSREAVNELVSSQRLDTFSDEGRKWANIKIDVILRGLKELPAVTPQEPKCKDCKWWKDSDGVYRRGVEADKENLCPINTHTVYRGEGYCYMFSPKADMREVEE